MKITTEITDRDKKLLLFLAIFVIVVVFGFFIIRPLAETDAALKEELAVQEELQIRTQQKLMLLPSMQANVEKTEEELAAAGFLPGYEESGNRQASYGHCIILGTGIQAAGYSDA